MSDNVHQCQTMSDNVCHCQPLSFAAMSHVTPVHYKDEELWKEQRRTFKQEMNKCKRDTWQKFVSEADEYDIWKVNNYLNTTPINTFIPTIEGEAAMNEQKTNTLKKIFFPPPPPADLSDIPNTNYPNSITTNLNITITQVKQAIDKLPPNKALRPDK